LDLLKVHVLASIDAGREDQVPDADVTLLQILAEELRAGLAPTPGEILSKAQAEEQQGFKRWSARGVASHLKRFGLRTHKSHGRKVYGRPVLRTLWRIQANYGIDLELPEPAPGNVPNVPQCTPTGVP